jgi:glycogen debranching enzyme
LIMSNYIKYKNKYYILATSSLADDRTMVLKQGDCFGVFDRYGDIHPIGQGAQGMYYEGTRFLSRMELMIEGQRPLILSSSLKEENEIITCDLTNPDFDLGNNFLLEKGTLHIHRTKFMWDSSCFENIRLSNFGIEPLTFSLSLNFNADYKDIFEIRGVPRKERGKLLKTKITHDELILGYKGLDNINRLTHINFETIPNQIEDKTAFYHVCLLPQAYHDISISTIFEIDGRMSKKRTYLQAHEELNTHLEATKNDVCDIYSSNEQFNEWLIRSRSDMTTMVSETKHGLYPYAGVPWYSTPFGRDGIITAWECLWMDPELTKGVLNFLALSQARDFNDFQDAEPGKIFHEMRGGEMAELGEVPFKLYYGTIDATPLFVSLAGAYYERTGDIETIRSIWPNIERALQWCDKYGDLDDDGFLEYAKKSEKGLVNQGWKDSHDSIFYEDGQLAQGPIALCEVQGYLYDAKVKASMIANVLGFPEKAEILRQQAETLREKFTAAFWIEEKQTFALALDGQKRQCKVVSSNAGHCLFSGIVKAEHAEKLSKTLMNEKMFSGWGIRTISTEEVRYNPMSYHNGSIWPHDNAMIALGLARYGFIEDVNKVLAAMFDVTMFVDAQRLPELFCGFEKRRNEGPTAYPVACSPQAWAVGSIYLMLQACLGIKIDAKANTIYFYKPDLPDFLKEITIANLKVNNSNVVLQVRKNIGEVTVHLLHRDGDVKIDVIEAHRWDSDKPTKMEKEYKI